MIWVLIGAAVIVFGCGFAAGAAFATLDLGAPDLMEDE